MIVTRPNRARKVRVAHVSLGLDVGGQEKLLVEFARHIDRDSFELTFVSLGSRGPLAATLENLGWPVVAMNRSAGVRPELLWRLRHLFGQRRCDVVHTHDEKPMVYGAAAARLAGVGTVVHTHHHGLIDPLPPRRALLVRVAGRLVDHFVCVSRDSARHMIAGGVPRSRVRVLWNGIDIDRFAYRGPDPSGPVVAVARLSPVKNLDVLLRAFARTARRRPHTTLEIAGDGPLRADLDRLADGLGVADRVRFIGEVRDVPAVLARASLFVLPSKTEGISLTLLEAMASGLPVVASNVGGNPEVVGDGVTGIIVEVGRDDQLAEAMLGVLNDPGRGRALGRAGRQRAESCFDIRRMVREYEDLYQQEQVVSGQCSVGRRTGH